MTLSQLKAIQTTFMKCSTCDPLFNFSLKSRSRKIQWTDKKSLQKSYRKTYFNWIKSNKTIIEVIWKIFWINQIRKNFLKRLKTSHNYLFMHESGEKITEQAMNINWLFYFVSDRRTRFSAETFSATHTTNTCTLLMILIILLNDLDFRLTWWHFFVNGETHN